MKDFAVVLALQDLRMSEKILGEAESENPFRSVFYSNNSYVEFLDIFYSTGHFSYPDH